MGSKVQRIHTISSLNFERVFLNAKHTKAHAYVHVIRIFSQTEIPHGGAKLCVIFCRWCRELYVFLHAFGNRSKTTVEESDLLDERYDMCAGSSMHSRAPNGCLQHVGHALFRPRKAQMHVLLSAIVTFSFKYHAPTQSLRPIYPHCIQEPNRDPEGVLSVVGIKSA